MTNWICALGIWAACIGCAGEIDPGTPPAAVVDAGTDEEDDAGTYCGLHKIVCEYRPEWECFWVELCSGNMEEVP